MDFRTISAVVADKTTDAKALAVATAMARRHRAALNIFCIGVDQMQFEPMSAGSTSLLVTPGPTDAVARAEELEAWVHTVVDFHVPEISVERVILPHIGLETGVGQLVRFSDLVIVSRPYGTEIDSLQSDVLCSALYSGGAPALVVAPNMISALQASTVMIAWDESDACLSAVRKALPFLRTASSVQIVMVEPPFARNPETGSALRLSEMLSRHRVESEVRIVPRTLPRISECLSRYMAENKCDLVVMGGHQPQARFRDVLLGGPTRDMLELTTTPLFMAS
ncbi:universal stress protein [Pelagovum pacificum]|nr:universal stress protein [Pelagovum pacificum]QQA42718.1 universal stress protein [Pelagovum pacificum]